MSKYTHDIKKVNYQSLKSEYSDPESLSYKKSRIVDEYIPDGGNYLDIGMGTGESIFLRLGKHDKIFGIDFDETSVSICKKKFDQYSDIKLMKAGINDIQTIFTEPFNCITCLDILEHIEEKDVAPALLKIKDSLNENGIFIFSGPGVFEKIKIFLGKSPTHLHSHSSYGWRNIIERAGFKILSIETVEFPIIHSNFLRKKIHLFGKCCIIVAQNRNNC
jgi:2-polyprenyl-3-methyl-5-hydroxy-6-metoxy-1,4-benzoquinol methylase